MRAQSAIEFLTTYSYLFIILGVVVYLLFFIGTSPKSLLPTQCTSYSGMQCNLGTLYINNSTGYKLMEFSFTNAEAVPINITDVSVLINTESSVGYCDPSVVMPGGDTVCAVPITKLVGSPSLVKGFYAVNASYCASGLSNISAYNCTGNVASYGGYFSVQPVYSMPLIFAVIALQSPRNQQSPPSESAPVIPSNWMVVQNGDWVTNHNGYAYGTASYQGNSYLGMKVVPFPTLVSTLNNNNVQCGATNPPSYNSTMSLAYTIIYSPGGRSVNVSVWPDDLMNVYYKSSSATAWQNVFGGYVGCCKAYGPDTMSLSSGFTDVAVLWSNVCAPGAQMLNTTGLPS